MSGFVCRSLSTFFLYFFFFSSRRRHTRYWRDWSSDVCSSDLVSDQVVQHLKEMDAVAGQCGKTIRYTHLRAKPFDMRRATTNDLPDHFGWIHWLDGLTNRSKAGEPKDLFDPSHQLLAGLHDPAQVAVRPLIEPALIIHLEQGGKLGHPPRRPFQVVGHVHRIALQFLQAVLQARASLLGSLVEARIQDGNGRLVGELLRETDIPVCEDPLLVRGGEGQHAEGSFRAHQWYGEEALAPQTVPYLQHLLGSGLEIIHDLGTPCGQGLE